MSIADKITRLQNAKTAIATAITNKGGTVSAEDGYEDFSNDIASIPNAIDVATSGEMASLNTIANEGKIYHYTGPNTTYYKHNCYYIVRVGSYELENVSGFYNFVEDSEDMYPSAGKTYKSTNAGINNSISVIKVKTHNCLYMTVHLNSWAEGGCDYTILSHIDAQGIPDSNTSQYARVSTLNINKNPRESLSSNWLGISISPGKSDHFFYIVYKKDNSVSLNDDAGRFIINESTYRIPYFEMLNAYDDTTLQITDLNEKDVTHYQKAQVVEPNIAPGNIKKDVNILGVTGTFEGGGGGDNGYNVYLRIGGLSDDDAYIQLNGETAKKIGYSNTGSYINIPASGIKTIKTWGFEHPGTYESISNSYVRWRVHGTSAWTYLNIGRSEASAQLLTLTSDIDLEVMQYTCLDQSTLITMSDGTKKKISEIRCGDKVKGYNNKEYIVYREEYGNKAYTDYSDIWTFENEYEIITCHRHRFYNVENQKFMYLQDFKIGEHAITENNEQVALLSYRRDEERICKYFSLWCNEIGQDKEEDIWQDGNNYYANGLLAGNRHSIEIKTIK